MTSQISHDLTEVLFLSSNIFFGSLDPILGGQLSQNLQGLYLSDNNFVGSLPAGLCALSGLSKSPTIPDKGVHCLD